MTELKTLRLDQIAEPTDAHRVTMSETALNELADSIQAIGLLNPIIVRRSDGEQFEIIAGHRRYIAHRMIGRETIEAFVRDATNDQMEDARFAENLQREQLSPMEEAVSVSRYMERSGKKIEQVARALNRTPWWVEHRLALLGMPGRLGDLVHSGDLPAGAALELAKVEDEKHREYLIEFAIRSGAAVAVVREWVNAWKLSKLHNPNAEPPKPDMPIEGQELIIQMPCFLCGDAHDHRKLRIVRVCNTCTAQVANANTGA